MLTAVNARLPGAVALIVGLGIALLIALTPYATGLIAIPVFYIILAPVHRWLASRIGVTAAANLVVALTIICLVLAGSSFVGLIINEARRVAVSVSQSPLLTRLTELKPAGLDLGTQAADLGNKAVSWIGSSAFAFLGSASLVALNLIIAFFGTFYLLTKPDETWTAIRPFIPFSAQNAEKLRQEFRDVTNTMLLGTGLSAVVQGAMVSLGFWVAGLPNAAFWGLVAMIFSILPVLGTGMVWGPAAAVLLAVWGLLAIGNVGYVIQPIVARRLAHMHPFVTLVGTLIGVPYFGLLGLLVGPLALTYFFELIAMFREEFFRAA